MGYVKYERSVAEYAGESFARTISKKDDTTWADTDEANFAIYDQEGEVVSSGTVDKSSDKTSMSFVVPSIDTAGLNGRYKLLIELTNSDDDRIRDVIAEYVITYKSKSA